MDLERMTDAGGRANGRSQLDERPARRTDVPTAEIDPILLATYVDWTYSGSEGRP